MNQHSLPSKEELERALGVTRGAKSRRWLRRLLWIVPLIALVFGAYWLWQQRSSAQSIVIYDTIDAKQTDVIVTVAATGTLQPITKVDVGSEMSGVMREVLVKDNDEVKTGQVLAQLDVSKFKLQRARLDAQVDAAAARLKASEADFDEAQRQMWRQIDLHKRGLATDEQRDAAVVAKDRAVPMVQSAKSELSAAKAERDVTDADIARGTIISPINGIVLKRAVEPGQTVAASLQAPVLFTLAQDLTSMQLEAAVDEADIGQVKVGQQAVFTVDAWRGKEFPAVTERMSFLPETVDGVVTYKTILSAANKELSLRPGMTATAKITVAEHKNVIAVSNEAFRYAPPRVFEKRSFSITDLFMPRFPRGERQRRAAEADGTRKLYVLRDDEAIEVKVKTGATDGKQTVITEGEIKAGDKIISGQRTAAQAGRP